MFSSSMRDVSLIFNRSLVGSSANSAAGYTEVVIHGCSCSADTRCSGPLQWTICFSHETGNALVA